MAIGRRKIYAGYKKRKASVDIFNYQEYWTPEKLKERKCIRKKK